MASLLFPDEIVEKIKINAEATYLDEWHWWHHYSYDDRNKVKYPDISVTATDKSMYGSLLMNNSAATVIHNLIKERMTKMENNMTAKIELLNSFETWAKNCHEEEFQKYLRAPDGSPMEQEASKKSREFDNIRRMLTEIKRNLECKKYEPSIICPVNIWENGNNTVVQWEDGTKTVVTAEHPESKSTFAGFCAALAKKIYGSTDKVMKQIDKAVENPKLPAKKRKEEEERRKQLREFQHELRVKDRELRIKREMDQMYITEEAKKRIDEQQNMREQQAAEKMLKPKKAKSKKTKNVVQEGSKNE